MPSLYHIGLTVENLEESVAFYRDVVGLTEIPESSDLEISGEWFDRLTENRGAELRVSHLDLQGVQLQLVPVSMSRWSTWRNKHPDTLVLSTDTGFDYDYTQDRYAEYRNSTGLFMPVSATDARVHAKTVVFGFDLATGAIAYTESVLKKDGTYRHDLSGEDAVITLHDDGRVTMQRGDQTLFPIRLFWFAWYTFHPDTDLIR